MKVKLVCIHKTNAPWINAGLQEFGKRLSNYISFEHIEIEINTQKFKTREALMSEEGKKVNQILKKTDYLILLDEGGKEFSSIKFADWINKKFVNVNNDIVFLVGGAYGFNDDLRSRANESISLSKMTFTHQMARLFFTEQLYRAMTILKNEPYHHQ
jgi:23S rRNA (pseudouridine1915-N3)-methyltransferase